MPTHNPPTHADGILIIFILLQAFLHGGYLLLDKKNKATSKLAEAPSQAHLQGTQSRRTLS